MFGSKNTSTSKSSGSSLRSSKSSSMSSGHNAIVKGTVIVGDINAEGDIRVDGKIIGTLVCNSKLVVTETGYIEGNVDTRNAKIAGEIKGNVITRELMEMDKTARIFGDIFTPKLVVHMGAIFTGNCKMGDAAKDALAKTPEKPGDLLAKSGANKGSERKSRINKVG